LEFVATKRAIIHSIECSIERSVKVDETGGHFERIAHASETSSGTFFTRLGAGEHGQLDGERRREIAGRWPSKSALIRGS
jgi:hypothetical protein